MCHQQCNANNSKPIPQKHLTARHFCFLFSLALSGLRHSADICPIASQLKHFPLNTFFGAGSVAPAAAARRLGALASKIKATWPC